MDFITLLFIAIGLSFDTFAVSISTGIMVTSLKFWQAIKIAFTLSFFQSLMPYLGWLLGKQVEQLINKYDHWAAFGLLTILGIKMIYESLKMDNNNKPFNPLSLSILIGMAIATSVDAFVVGVSFAFIKTNIYWSVLVIASVTFVASMAGIISGKKAGGRLGKRMEVLGGLILIGIGLKILLSHVT